MLVLTVIVGSYSIMSSFGVAATKRVIELELMHAFLELLFLYSLKSSI
jgi:hypothetical protein